MLLDVWGLLWEGSVAGGDATAEGWNHLMIHLHECQLG